MGYFSSTIGLQDKSFTENNTMETLVLASSMLINVIGSLSAVFQVETYYKFLAKLY